MPHAVAAALADAVLVVHLLFILYVVLGGLLVLRWRWTVWVHLNALLWGALLEFCGWLCPLTPLEKWLRNLAGEGGYSGGFIAHYLVPLIYPPGLTGRGQVVLGVAVILINALVYTTVLSRRISRPHSGRR